MLLGPASAFPAVFSSRMRTYWRPVLSETSAPLVNHRLQSFMLNVISEYGRYYWMPVLCANWSSAFREGCMPNPCHRSWLAESSA
jgi:hypothetical protein